MSTVTARRKKIAARDVPALNSGDRLTQREFHRLYELSPDSVKAELIGGIVYMPSPLSLDHGLYHSSLGGVFFFYQGLTPGVDVADNVTTILGEHSEPQPDLTLRILPEYGGRSRLSKKYLAGPAELLAEISQSSRSIDLHLKKEDYQSAGVQEYIVLCLKPLELHWFRLQAGGEIRPNTRGVFRSRVFPGLWIDGPALLARNGARLIEVVQEGMASREHADFVRQLEERRARKS